MAGETILVLDGDQEMEQRMTTPLEAKGYLVFTASSQLLNPESLDKLSPSLIYIKPLSPSAAGLEPCKAIHGIPTLKDVPIVLLASLKGSSDPRHLKGYGIVDFLRPQFGPEELIEMTETILGKTGLSQPLKISEAGREESARDSQAARHAAKAEDQRLLTDEEFLELTPSEKRVPTAVNEAWAAGEEEQDMRPAEGSEWSKASRGKEKKRPAHLSPVIGVGIVVVIVGGGFLAYQQFFAPAGKVQTIRPATAPVKPRATPSATKASPASKAADASAPALAAPSASTPSTPSPPSAASATSAASTSQAPTSAASTAPAKPPVSTAPAPTTTAPAPASQTTASAASTTSTRPPAPATPARTATAPAPTSQAPTSTASTTSTKPPAPTTPGKTTASTAPASPVPSTVPAQKSSRSLEPASKAPHKPFFSVQVGAFKNEVHAQALMKTLKEKGYDAFIQQGVAKDKSPIYRVLVSKYEDRKAAENLAREMQSKEKIRTALYAE